MIGHTDTTGSTASNYRLGTRARAGRPGAAPQGGTRRLAGRRRVARRSGSSAAHARQHRRAPQPARRDHDPVTKAAADDTSVARAESRRFVLLCGLAPALITVALVIFRPDFVADVDCRAYDTLLRSIPTKPPDGRVAIVDIDDLSLSTIGQWPWRRDRIAQLIARLREQGAAVIALDVVFAEPIAPIPTRSNRRRGTRAWRARCGRPRRARLRADLRHRRRPPRLHPAFVPRPDASSRRTKRSMRSAVSRRGRDLQPAGAGAGRRQVRFLNAVPDTDGILRRVPLVIELQRDHLSRHSHSRRFSRRPARRRLPSARRTRTPRRSSSPPARFRSTAEATCSSATVASSVRFPTSRRWTCSPAAMPATSSRTPSSSSGRRRSAVARSCRRRSIPGSQASKSRPPSPTTCCAAISSRVPSTR